jgi:hypothetical protein
MRLFLTEHAAPQISGIAGPGFILSPTPHPFANARNTHRLIFDDERPDFVKAKSGIGISPLLYQNVNSESLYLLPLNCGWASENVPIAIYLTPLDSTHKIFTRTQPNSLVKFNLEDKSFSSMWRLVERRDIVIRQLEVIKERIVATPHVLALKYSEQLHFRSFGKFRRSTDFKKLAESDTGILRRLGESHIRPYTSNDRATISYEDTIWPELEADEAYFTENFPLTILIQVDILSEMQPVELCCRGWIPRHGLHNFWVAMAEQLSYIHPARFIRQRIYPEN